MNKKMSSLLLAGAVIGLICFMAYQAMSGAFSKGQVYYNPEAVISVEAGDAVQTAQNYNALGFRLLGTNGNMCISPNMIASSLGYYYEGAVDEGREEAAAMLGSSTNVKENHGALVKALTATPSKEQDAYFTGLFMDKNTKPKKPFLDAAPYYGMYFETFDFYDFAAAKTKMDEAAKKLSSGKLQQGINFIGPKSSMVFASDLDVKYRFSRDIGQITTETKDFAGRQMEYINIDKAKVLYYEDDKAVYMQIPLEDGYVYEITMAKGHIGAITLADIKAFRESAKEEVVAISMPKPQFFGYYELKENLKAVGFSAAFDKTTIIMNLTDSVKVKVDKIDHGIRYEVLSSNESKVEGKITKTVNIDKPHYFFASDKETGCNIIMGKNS